MEWIPIKKKKNLGEKKVVAGRVVVLYSNDCTGIRWGDSALVVLDEWLSYSGSRLNRFDCNPLS